LSNIEPLARAITERVCRKVEGSDPASPRMTDAEVAAWVDGHWECAAAELEAGLLDDDGNRVPDANWELSLEAYVERVAAKRRVS